jgi:hypothetical protein
MAGSKPSGPRKILRPDRHLWRLRVGAPREGPHWPAQNSKPEEWLKRAAGISPKSNINRADKSCGKLAAKPLAQIFLRQSRDGGVAARGSGRNLSAMDVPQICHGVERSGAEDTALRSWEDRLPVLLHVSDSPAALGGFGGACAGEGKGRVIE